MIQVTVNKLGNFPVNSAKIKKAIVDTLEKEGVVSDFSVSVAIVNEAQMDELVKKHYKDDPEGEYDHPILTFPNNEIKSAFVDSPDEIPSLGEIILSFNSIVEEAKETGKLVDEVACALAEHGAHHLLGHHH